MIKKLTTCFILLSPLAVLADDSTINPADFTPNNTSTNAGNMTITTVGKPINTAPTNNPKKGDAENNTAQNPNNPMNFCREHTC